VNFKLSYTTKGSDEIHHKSFKLVNHPIIMYKYIFVLLGIVLIVAVATSPSVTSAIPNRSNEHYATCLPTGNPTGNGGQEVQCCWLEKVPPGTGGVGNGDWEEYCSNCENGGTRGNINCSDPELQYRQGGKPLPPITGTINNGPNSDGGKPLPPLLDTINNGPISDEPEAGNDRNPSIPPTEGVTDETENDDNSGDDNSGAGSTIPRKGGDLDTSNLNENVIVQ
jgi:hypothetical protein